VNQFTRFDQEMAFAKRLSEHGVTILTGRTDGDSPKSAIRAAIVGCGFDCTIFGPAPNGKPETYAQAFERIYGEPLEARPRKTEHHGYERMKNTNQGNRSHA